MKLILFHSLQSHDSYLKNVRKNVSISLHKKCPFSELFWSAFSRIWTEYGAPYSVRMRENADQNNSEYGHLLSSVSVLPYNEH